MSARIIDGRAIAEGERRSIAERAKRLREDGIEPALDAVLIDFGDNAARTYAANQARKCDELGIGYRLHELESDAPQAEIVALVQRLGRDEAVTGIMVHMPLPFGVDADNVKAAIEPSKDVEGVHPSNIGNIVYGRSTLAPCTGLAAMRLIEETGIELRGKRVVVVGSSVTVGRPLAAMLMQHEATVVSCNKHTWGLEEMARSADVLIAAAGVPELVKGDWVRTGAVVIDVGINRVETRGGGMRTVGDVAFDAVSKRAGWISPVPGGVGPVTVSMLLRNVIACAEAGKRSGSALGSG